MSEKKNFLSNKIISNQLKKAIFLSFIEAKKYGTKSVNSKLLLYGILKIDSSLVTQNINDLYKSTSMFNNKIDKILRKCEQEFKNSNKVILEDEEFELNFSTPIRRLLFLIIRSLKGRNFKVVTTLHVFNYLIRNKSMKKWLKESLNDS